MASLYIIDGATYNGDGTTSAEAVGSTVTITIASPGVVTWTGHSFVANDVVYLTTTGALPTGLTATTKYYVRNPATNTFELSATSGGASINTSGTQSGTHTGRGVGAWNHIDIIAGTAVGIGSSIAAGDTVYIRSKTGAGANASVSYAPGASKSFGSSSATSANPVRWILDNGSVWSGVSGTLMVTVSSSAYVYTFLDYNHFYSPTAYNWIFENTVATPTIFQMLFNAHIMDGIKISVPNTTTASWGVEFSKSSEFRNCYFYMGGINSASPCLYAFQGRYVFDNCKFEVATTPSALTSIFIHYGNYGLIELRGGYVTGSGITSGNVALMTNASYISYTSHIRGIGFQMPKTMPLTKDDAMSGTTASMIGMDNGSGGYYVSDWGSMDSRNISNNYPTLNATLADSTNTPTSWRVYPKNCTKQRAFEVPVSKLYTDTADTKTLTMHFLATTSWAGTITPDTNTVWMDVSYIDNSSGLTVMQTTRALTGAALTTSGLTWTPSNAWGAVSMTAYKLFLTTTGSIKKDTNVTISLRGVTGSGNSSDIYIVCPDVQLS